MSRCKIVQILISVFPLKFWQGFLIRAHMQNCERCTSRVASQDEVKALIIKQEDVGGFKDFWPAVKSGIIKKDEIREKRDFSFRRWAFAAVGIVAVFLAGFLFYSVLFQDGILLEQEAEARFKINSIRVADEPATPFIYQPKDSDMILVWAEKGM